MEIQLDKFSAHHDEVAKMKEEYNKEWENKGGRDIIKTRIRDNAEELADSLLELAFKARSESVRLRATEFAITHITEAEKEDDIMRDMLSRFVETETAER